MKDSNDVTLKEGDAVLVSFKDYENDGWYINRRHQKGIVGKDSIGYFVKTDYDSSVRENQITAITVITNQSV